MGATLDTSWISGRDGDHGEEDISYSEYPFSTGLIGTARADDIDGEQTTTSR